MSEGREKYLDFYRGWIADARAVCEELDEPMEVVLPLLVMNGYMATMERLLLKQREWAEEEMERWNGGDKPWENP